MAQVNYDKIESMYKIKMKTTNEKQEINVFSGNFNTLLQSEFFDQIKASTNIEVTVKPGEKQDESISKEFADKETQTDFGCFCQHFNTVKSINSEKELGGVIRDLSFGKKNANAAVKDNTVKFNSKNANAVVKDTTVKFKNANAAVKDTEVKSKNANAAVKDTEVKSKNANAAFKDANTDMKDKDIGNIMSGNKSNSWYNKLGPVLQESKDVEKKTIKIDFTEEEPNIKDYMKTKRNQNLIKLTQDLELEFKPPIVEDNYKLNIPDKTKEVKSVVHVNNEKEEFNVLVLGQSGVGKSTWINCFMNYMMFETLTDAKQHGVVKIIPTTFTITDDEYNTIVVDSNELVCSEKNVGVAGTTRCDKYRVIYKNKTFYLIDTPGVIDAGGLENDHINITNILQYVKQFQQIHAICVLLKPNETKLSGMFEICINELFSQLHKSARPNLIFCLTNTRSTFYQPGDTIVVLKSLFKDIKLDKTLDKSVIYCYDNEPYRYLCTHKIDKVTFDEHDVENFNISWNKSKNETYRLLDYILTLKPHEVKETVALNNARIVVEMLLPPVLDILQMITMLSHDLTDQNSLKHWRVTENKIYHDEQIKCSKCVELGTLPMSGRTYDIYTVCQNKVSHPDNLIKKEKCIVCGCPRNYHHIDRYTIHYSEENININEMAELNDQIVRLREEKHKMLLVCSRFTYYLKHYSLTCRNDVMLDYLLQHEENQKLLMNTTNIARSSNILFELTNTIKQYQDINVSVTRNRTSKDISMDELQKWENELYELPSHGRHFAIVKSMEKN